MNDEPVNHGAILGRQPTDWVAGAIPFEERKPNGDWKQYTDPWSVQFRLLPSGRVDYMRCLTEAILTSIETQEFFLTGKRVRYSRRWIAKMSGTTEQGNWGYKVADAIRHFGLVLDESYPTGNLTWKEHYQEIPEPLYSRLLAEGQEHLKTHEYAYEWLIVEDPNLDHHLKQAPLMVIIPGHGVCGINSPTELIEYVDSYIPYYKQTKVVNLSDAMKFVLTMKGNEHMKIINDNGTYFLVGEKGKMGLNGNEALNFFKSLTDQEEKGSTSAIPSKGTFEKTLAIDVD